MNIKPIYIEQKDRQLLEIGRLHLALSKCAALELENARISAVNIDYWDEYGDDNCANIPIETDDIAQQEIHDVLIRYKQRLQNKLNLCKIGLAVFKDGEKQQKVCKSNLNDLKKP